MCFACVCALFFWLVSRFLNNDSKKTWKAGSASSSYPLVVNHRMDCLPPETKESFLHDASGGWDGSIYCILYYLLFSIYGMTTGRSGFAYALPLTLRVFERTICGVGEEA